MYINNLSVLRLDIRRGQPAMSKIILIIFFFLSFLTKTVSREFKMKYFKWEHTVAATVSKIFYKYQRNAAKRARVRSSLL